MTSSFVKIMLSLISKVPVCFFRSRECAYLNSHGEATVSSEKGICDMDTRVYFD